MVGSGGREHALAWKLSASPSLTALHAAPGNPGIAALGDCHPVHAEDSEGLLALAASLGIDLVVVGPEAPLVAGVADELRHSGIVVFGPGAGAAEIEGSKSFAKDVMRAAGVPIPEAKAIARPPCVVKADGLAAGKGVVVCRTQEELDAGLAALSGFRGPLVIEELLEGPEVSLFAICDGAGSARARACPGLQARVCRRHRPQHRRHGRLCPGRRSRRCDGRRAGGAGAQARPRRAGRSAGSRSWVSSSRGLMLTDGGPKVLEFNCRFGDPETQAVLPLVDGDLLEVLAAAARGDLAGGSVERVPGAAVTVVVTAGGYPETRRPRIADRGCRRGRGGRGARLPRGDGAARRAASSPTAAAFSRSRAEARPSSPPARSPMPRPS